MLELLVGLLGLCCLTWVVYHYGPKIPYFVNCWFCNKNQWVKLSDRNSFYCKECDQYNGFNKNGDYNKYLLEQKVGEMNNVVNSCENTASPIEFVNGLCEECNGNQQLLIERLNKFEAKDDSNFEDEYQMYKMKLDRMFPLCHRCQSFSTNKIRCQAKGLKIQSPEKPMIKKKNHDHTNRKQFFNSGWITNLANLINVNISLVLFLSHLYQLEKHQKTGLPKLDDFLPVFILDGFKIIDRCAYIFGIAAVSLFLLGHIKSATRTNFPELIAGLFWPIYLIFVNFASQTEPFFSNTKSIAAIFLLMISLAILLCPKKRKHMKKPNTILSAFSVASTPVSQCSSHWTVNHSRHLNNSSFALPEDVSSTFDLSDNRMEIDDDARTTISKSTAFSTFRERKEMRSRENTPTRDLNKKLDIMNLDGLPTPCFNDEDDFFDTRSHISTKSSLLSPKAITPSKIHVNSPFNSLTINPNVGRAQSIYGGSTFSTFSSVSKSPNFFQQSRTPSVFSQTPTTLSFKSAVTRNESIRSPFIRPTSNPPMSFGTPSEFTSISQREEASSSKFWIIGSAIGILIVGLLLMNYYQMMQLQAQIAANSKIEATSFGQPLSNQDQIISNDSPKLANVKAEFTPPTPTGPFQAIPVQHDVNRNG